MTDSAAFEKPEPGWYLDKKWPGFDRYWTGEEWTDRRRESPEEMPFSERAGFLLIAGIVTGILTGALGAIAFESEETLGTIVFIVGGTLASLLCQIAVIAMGVDLGIRMSKRR